MSYRGHTDAVTAITRSPDSKRVASGSLDKTVQVWDTASGSHIFSYKGHSDGVQAVAWSPDGKRVASGSLDKTVQVWDAASGNLLYSYKGHTGAITSLAWSPDSRYIASGSYDKTVQVWDASNGKALYTYRGYNVAIAHANNSKGVLPDLIFVVAWSHNGKRIATVTEEYCGDVCGVMLFWDALTERNVAFYPDLPTFALAWSPDDQYVVTALADNTVQISRAT